MLNISLVSEVSLSSPAEDQILFEELDGNAALIQVSDQLAQVV